jgi:hypothetical protein
LKPQLTAIAVLVMSGAQSGRPTVPACTLQESLLGTWRLVAARQHLSDGSVRPDPGPGAHGVGYIMYDATKHVCVVLANPDRPKWKSPKSPTDAEIHSAFEGVVAYCGTYETNEKQQYVIHHVEADKNPQVMGTDRIRRATVTGDRLVLRPVDLPAGVSDWTVEWVRVDSTRTNCGHP